MKKNEKIFIIIFSVVVFIAVIGFVTWNYYDNNYSYESSDSQKSNNKNENDKNDKTESNNTSTKDKNNTNSTNNNKKEESITAKYRKLYTFEQYKAMCKSIPYKDLSRNPDNYRTNNIYFKGKVIQAQEDSRENMVMLRVNTKMSNYTYYENDYVDDTIIVALYEYDKNNRVLEDDIIEVWGISGGIFTYESVVGSEISLPSMIGVYWNVK